MPPSNASRLGPHGTHGVASLLSVRSVATVKHVCAGAGCTGMVRSRSSYRHQRDINNLAADKPGPVRSDLTGGKQPTTGLMRLEPQSASCRHRDFRPCSEPCPDANMGA